MPWQSLVLTNTLRRKTPPPPYNGFCVHSADPQVHSTHQQYVVIRCLWLTIISLQRAWYGNGSFLTGNRFRTISVQFPVLQNTYSVPFRGSFPAGKCVFWVQNIILWQSANNDVMKKPPCTIYLQICVVSYHFYFCLMQILIKIIVAGVKDDCTLDVAS